MHIAGMIYGYARVSSTSQDLAQQLAQLDAAGCTKIYREKVSAATAERPQLKHAIAALDAGDVLMVTSTDRLARNTRDLLNILHAVREAGAGFRSIAEPMVDTTSQFAEVIIAVLGVAASYERHRITERTAAGRGQGPWREVRPAHCPYPSPAGRSAPTARCWRYAAHCCRPTWCRSGDDIAAAPNEPLNGRL
jgi:DNA invertase Pin-like site-specific DNA recombinase